MARGPARLALLVRGINVGTKNSLPMAELRAMLSELGCTDVATYAQSGNAAFSTTRPPGMLRSAIEAALARRMGRHVDTTLRTSGELAAILAENPLAEHAASPSKLCVTFLEQAPTDAQLEPLRALATGAERFVARGREIYSWHPDGLGRSPLAAAIYKLAMDGAVTTRNLRTVTELARLTGSAA